jgi:hypothetical protein
MRVVRNIEPRVVTEQQRRVFDTFIRPTINEDKRMFELADTLNKIAPVIRNYKDEADQARYNKEVAEGYAASANFKPDEVPADRFYRYSSVNANEYAKRSRAFQHGVNIHEAEALANTLPTAADEWFRTQSYNGRRIFEIDDPVQFNEAYRSFIRQYIQGETGGSMDPQIYQKYLSGPISQTEHNVTQQFLSERRKVMEDRATNAFTASITSGFGSTFGTSAHRNNRTSWVKNSSAAFNAQIEGLAGQIGDRKAGNAASNVIVSYFGSAKTMNELNDIRSIALSSGLIQHDPNNLLQIQKAYETRKFGLEQEARHREQMARIARAERERNQLKAQMNQLYDAIHNSRGESFDVTYEKLRAQGFNGKDIYTVGGMIGRFEKQEVTEEEKKFLSSKPSIEEINKAEQEGKIRPELATKARDALDGLMNTTITDVTDHALKSIGTPDDNNAAYNFNLMREALQEHMKETYKLAGGSKKMQENPIDMTTKFRKEAMDYLAGTFSNGSDTNAIYRYRMKKEQFISDDRSRVFAMQKEPVLATAPTEVKQVQTVLSGLIAAQKRKIQRWLPYPQIEATLTGHNISIPKVNKWLKDHMPPGTPQSIEELYQMYLVPLYIEDKTQKPKQVKEDPNADINEYRSGT